MTSPFPWALGQMQHAPIGLREAVARIAYLTPAAAATYAQAVKPSLLRTVAQWRCARPAEWLELLASMEARA